MRKLGFGLVEGPWGARVPEAVARALDKQRSQLPAEFRDSLQRFTCKGTAMALGDRQEDSWISTDTIDITSENMEMARRPNLSISPPTTGETTIPGRLESAANNPAFAADPVSSSTIHGTVIKTTPFAPRAP